MFNPYKQFKLLYPKSIQIETVIFIFHIFRKTILVFTTNYFSIFYKQ